VISDPGHAARLRGMAGRGPGQLDHVQRVAGGPLDQRIQLHERHREPLREPPSNRRFSGTPNAEQCNQWSALARAQAGFRLGDHFPRRGAEGRRHIREPQHRDISGARFELGQKASRYSACARQRPLG